MSNDPKIAALQGKVNESRALMANNVQLAIDRTGKLQDMELTSIQLEEDSNRFKIGAERVKRSMCVRAWKWRACIALAVIVLLLIIIVPIAVSVK